MATNKEQRKYVCTMDKPLYFDKHVWDLIWLLPAHIFGAHGIYMLFVGDVSRSIAVFSFIHGYFAGSGITVGCHRLWAHKTFKANIPLQLLLMYMQTAAAQYPIFKWCRDHRIHHKYVETDADPHDSRRGFFYSHMGWLFVKENPAVQEKENTIDFSDLDNDPIVRFQTKYYWYLLFIAVFLVPMSLQHLIWPQMTLYQLFCVNYVWYLASLHITWLVNSAAHMWGFKPYDKNIKACNNRIVALLAVGEGWHNYHHTFPWDYKAAELGLYKLNWSTLIIDFFAWIGWASDLKTVPEKIVRDRVKRTGDGSHSHSHGVAGGLTGSNFLATSDADQEKEVLPPWGWGDKDIPEEHYQITQSLRASKAA